MRGARASRFRYGSQEAKDGSAEMNIWLHKRVMEEPEKNGGKVSAALRD